MYVRCPQPTAVHPCFTPQLSLSTHIYVHRILPDVSLFYMPVVLLQPLLGNVYAQTRGSTGRVCLLGCSTCTFLSLPPSLPPQDRLSLVNERKELLALRRSQTCQNCARRDYVGSVESGGSAGTVPMGKENQYPGGWGRGERGQSKQN